MKNNMYLKILLGVVVGIFMSSLSFGSVLVVKQAAGVGEYSTIQSALDAAVSSPGATTVEVQDNGTYPEELTFTTDSLALQAGLGNTPTIAVSNSPASGTHFHELQMTGNKIKGFTLTHTGTPPGAKGGLTVFGGGAVMENCTLIGSDTIQVRGTSGAVPVLTNNCELSHLGIALLFDGGGTGTVSNTYIHNGAMVSDGYAISLSGASSINNVIVENCTFDTMYRCVNSNSGGSIGVFNNCRLLNAGTGRTMQIGGTNGIGSITFNDCLIAGGQSDLVLENGSAQKGLIALNRCILKDPAITGACINSAGSTLPCTIAVDHCDIVGNKGTGGQWAVTASNAYTDITVKNSIITGYKGVNQAGAAVFVCEYNDVYVEAGGTRYSGLTPSTDYNINPQYLEMTNPDDTNFFKYPTFVGLSTASDTGDPIGSRGPAPPTAASDWILYN